MARTKKPEPTPVPPVAAPAPRTHLLALRLVAVAVATAAGVFLLVGGERDPAPVANGTPRMVTPEELRDLARSSGAAVYWAGTLDSRALELTVTPGATFVRYLPADGGRDSGSSLTVATYPLQDAYATAARRSRGEGMTSRRIGEDGIAVWSRTQPTSVYLARRGAPSLVEIYAPRAAEARAVALSGRVKPVR